MTRMGIPCPVCGDEFSSYLNLARHMVQKERPFVKNPEGGEHILYLEEVMGKPFVDFGWGKDKQIGMALKKYLG